MKIYKVLVLILHSPTLLHLSRTMVQVRKIRNSAVKGLLHQSIRSAPLRLSFASWWPCGTAAYGIHCSKGEKGDLQPGSWPKKIGVWWPKTFSVLVGLAHPRTFLRKRFASFQCLKGFIVLYPLWKQWRNVPVLSWWKHIPVLQIPIRTVTQSIAQPIPRISVLLMGSVQRLWHCYILPHGNLHYTILATHRWNKTAKFFCCDLYRATRDGFVVPTSTLRNPVNVALRSCRIKQASHPTFIHSCGRIDSFSKGIFEASRKLKKVGLVIREKMGRKGLWSLSKASGILKSCQVLSEKSHRTKSKTFGPCRQSPVPDKHSKSSSTKVSSYEYVEGRSVWGSNYNCIALRSLRALRRNSKKKYKRDLHTLTDKPSNFTQPRHVPVRPSNMKNK